MCIRDSFIPMMDEDRYTDRSNAFDKIISATHKHFWDPLDKKYIDFDQPFDLENEHIVNPEGPFGLELEVPSIAEKLTEKQKRLFLFICMANLVRWINY